MPATYSISIRSLGICRLAAGFPQERQAFNSTVIQIFSSSRFDRTSKGGYMRKAVHSFGLVLGLAVSIIQLACLSSGSKAENASRYRAEAATTNASPTALRYVELTDEATFVVADSKSVWKTEDAGKQWRQILAIAENDYPQKQVRGLSFLSPNTGFVVVGEH